MISGTGSPSLREVKYSVDMIFFTFDRDYDRLGILRPRRLRSISVFGRHAAKVI
jgi:hypothetical protein